MDTKVVGVTGVDFKAEHHYRPFSDCYRIGMRAAEQDGAAGIFLTADQVWSDGAFTRILTYGDQGKRAVLIAGPRVLEETVLPEFDNLYRKNSGTSLAISSKIAVKLANDHLHPWDRSLFWDDNGLGRPASFMYWSVGAEGFIMRCFHLHPVMVKPVGAFPKFNPTIDNSDFVKLACDRYQDIHIVEDSEDIMYFSIAPGTQSSELIERELVDNDGIMSWVRSSGLSRYNLNYAKAKMRFHYGEMSSNWEVVEKLSDRLLDPVLARMEKNIVIHFYRALKYIHTRMPNRLKILPRKYRRLKRIVGIRPF